MLVNELAKTAGVEAHVVRYYARIGLLKPRRNPDNSYQLFGHADLARLKRIQELQGLGFSLAEIRELLETEPNETPDYCAQVLAGLKRNVARNRRRIAKLAAQQQRMEAALEEWPSVQCQHPRCTGACAHLGAADTGRGRRGSLDLCVAHTF